MGAIGAALGRGSRIRKAAARLAMVVAAVSMAVCAIATSQPTQAYARDLPSEDVWLEQGHAITYGARNTYPRTAYVGDQKNAAYCMEPAKDAYFPDGKWCPVYSLSGHNRYSELRWQMWFGYGGPGFDESLWPSTWYDHTPMTPDRYVVLTHILVADTYSSAFDDAVAGCSTALRDYVSYNVLGYGNTGTPYNANSTAHKIEARANEVPGENAFQIMRLETGTYTQNMLTFAYYPTGYCQLKKVSGNTTVSDNNPNYSLAGAEYGVYSDSGCTNRVGTLTTDANGDTNAIELDEGTYYVKEVKASAGYKVCDDVHVANITSGNTTVVSCTETPQADTMGISLYKQDAANRIEPQGDATLENAQFEVKFYAVDPNSVNSASDLLGKGAARTWTIKTVNENGTYVARLNNACKVGGDDWYSYNDGAAQAYLPIGVVSVTEKSNPTGYNLNSKTNVMRINADGSVTYVDWDKTLGQVPSGITAGAVNDNVVTGTITGTKIDAERDKAVPQGDATLGGAAIKLINRSKHSVVIDGETVAVNGTYSKYATTRDNGTWSFENIPYGTYEVREAQASEGYLLNSSWSATVEVREQGKTYSVDAGGYLEETIGRGSIKGTKADADTNLNKPQGNATLAGCVIELVNASTNSIMIDGRTYAAGATIEACETNDKGEYSFKNLPYGTYRLSEVTAPSGYTRNEAWSATVKIRTNGKTETVDYAKDVKDTVNKSGRQLVGVKIDHELDEAYAQGDATLKGAKISVYNESEHSVWVGGKEYAPVKNGDYDNATPIETVETDAAGNYEFNTKFVEGTYTVKETKAPAGYLFNADWHYTFSVDQNNQQLKKIDGIEGLSDDVIRGGISVTKVDKQRDEAVAESAATLVGAEITITNKSGKDVLIDGVRYADGEDLDPVKSPSIALVTNGDGVATTTATALPYGTYELRETKASKGYVLNSDWRVTVKIRENGKVVACDTHASDHLEQQVIRSDFNFDKVEMASDIEMAGIPFLVTSRATGESHLIVSDENGRVDTAVSFVKHSQNTNASDAALDADKTAIADESKLVTDGSAGVWFNGYADYEVTPDDSVGALPYGVYDVRELACSANAEHNLVEFTVTVSENGVNIDEGVKEDSLVTLSTTLTWEGGKEVPMAESVTLTDEVNFENIKRGDHTMTAIVHAVDENGKDVGEVARATRLFINTITTGHIGVDIDIDTTELGNKKLVCFEYLDLKDDGTYMAKHEDLSDEGQTVKVPKPEISTKAAGDVEQESLAASSVKLIDTVSYKNCTPGNAYELHATVHLRNNGKDVGVLTDVDGNPIEVIRTFTPQSASGEIEMSVNVDASSLEGQTVVFFENLYWKGYEMATHADISDDGQSISFPKVRTKASEKTSGEQMAEAKSDVTIVDAVSYSNLTVGKEYEVSGVLHIKNDDGTDGGVLYGGDGKAYTALKKFTPEKASGSVSLEFNVDASVLGGKTLVAFETVTREGVTVGVHADITDESQTVRIPTISTTMTDANGKHETQVVADKSGKRTVELTDTVAYENLETGRTYIMSGTLHKRAADGTDAGVVSGAKATTEFTPETPDGTVDIKFNIDASVLDEGECFVAFETLSLKSDKNTEVASHEDISDEGQTVHVVDIRTTATGDASGSHEEQASSSTCIHDEVAYSGLTPGKEYKLSGALHIKNSDDTDAGPLKDADGNAVTAEVAFTPEKSAGTVALTFTFDASPLAGKSVVAFETLSRDGVDIASHADIADEGQTVNIVQVHTTATDGITGVHEGQASEKTVFNDEVAYEGLTPGKEYKVFGELHLADTDADGNIIDSGVVVDKDGNIVKADATFTPDAADGNVTVTFEFDTSVLAGKKVVAFEYLYEGKHRVAMHADIADEGQTVDIVDLHTTATGDVSGTHEEQVAKETAINDVVAYEGLTPGKEYKLFGELHLKNDDGTDGGVLKGADGNAVTAEAEFVPESANGEVTVTFTFDASKLAGKSVVAFETLSRDGVDIASHADIADEDQTVNIVQVHTTLKGNASETHEEQVSEHIVLNDVVAYEGLTPGKEYKLFGELHLKNDDGTDGGVLKGADGNAVTAEAEFVPESANGEVTVTFTFDASKLAGKSVVAFETLSRNGVDIASHADIADEDQTVNIVDLHTTATGDVSGTHEEQAAKETTINDVVAYEGLTPGKQYKLFGELYVKDANSNDEFPAAAVTDADGNAVTAEAEFVPESANGEVTVTFTFDASKLAGKSVVAFETLSRDDKVIATHADLEDEGQTVDIVDLHTTATGAVSGTHEEQGAGKVTIEDVVAYTGLTVDKEYKVAGELHLKNDDGTDAGVLTDADGNAVAAEAVLTPKKSDGEVRLNFTFDASLLAGKSVVAFETLSRDGVDIAVHADIADEDQTVAIIDIKTNASDKATGDHSLTCAEKVTLVDTVSYKGLTPGKEYKVSGTAHVKGIDADGNIIDGGILKDADGNAVTAEVTFTPKKEDGTVDVEFEFDSTVVAGKTLVVFETLSRDGVDIASHADIEDEDQTVVVIKIGTKASDKADGDSVIAAEGNQTIVDEVSYSGLSVGKEYRISGTLHLRGEDGSDMGVLKGADGKPVTAENVFVPKEGDGAATLEFTFDASLAQGQTIVVFEDLYRDNELVATHSDITDDAQAVIIEVSETPVTPTNHVTLQTGIDSLAIPAAVVMFVAAGTSVVLKRRKSDSD